MVLHIHIDVSFISEPEDNIIVVGYHYIIPQSVDHNKPSMKHPPLNVLIHVKCTTMPNVLENIWKKN